MDTRTAVRNVWLSLLGIPVAWLASFLLGSSIASAAGLPPDAKAPLGLAMIIVGMVGALYGAAAAVAFVLGRRAERAGVPRAMLPAWIVLGFGVLTVAQNLVAYFFA